MSHPSLVSIQNEEKQLTSEIEIVNDEELDITQVSKRIMDFIAELQPTSILISEFNGNFVYQIPIEGFNAEKMFEEMEKNKERLRITDWGLSQCSLEDVFTRICSV